MTGGANVPHIDGFADLVEIGRGGFSRVFSAVQLHLHRAVAIKVVEAAGPDARRFEREALAMGALSRVPNIVPTYQVAFADDGRPALVMELMASSLAVELRRQRPSPQVVAAWLFQIAEAVDGAHALGIVHRDIKPENVLLRANGSVLLADFGISSLRDVASGTTTSFSMSPNYAPPERFREIDDTPALGDVYSLGATIFAALVGHPPFNTVADGGALGLMERITSSPLPEMTGVPAGVHDVLSRAMAKRPADRFPTAGAFAAAFADAVAARDVRHAVLDADPTVRRPLRVEPPPLPTPGRTAFVPLTVVRQPPASAGASVALVPAPTVRPRRTLRTAAISGAAICVVVGAVIAAVALWPRVDPPRVAGFVRIPGHPIGLAGFDGRIWATDGDGGEVAGIRPGRMVVDGSFAAGNGQYGVAATADALWVANGASGTLTRYGRDGTHSDVKVGQGPYAVVPVGSSVVVTNGLDGTASEISAEGLVGRTMTIGGAPQGAALAGDQLWIADAGPTPRCLRVDLGSGTVVGSVDLPATPDAVGYGMGSIWVTNVTAGEVYRIDPRTERIVARVRVGSGPQGVAFLADAVWVTVAGNDEVVRIDPETNRVDARVATRGEPVGITAFEGKIWVADHSAAGVEVIEP